MPDILSEEMPERDDKKRKEGNKRKEGMWLIIFF